MLRILPLLCVLVLAFISSIAALRSGDGNGDEAKLNGEVITRVFDAPVQVVAGLTKPTRDSARPTSDALNVTAISEGVPNFNNNPQHTAVIPGLDTKKFAGKIWALHIWASWCEACRHEGPALLAMADLLPQRVAGLAYIDNENDVLRFANKYGLHYAALGIDQQGDAGLEWGAVAVPETLLIDQSGKVRWRYRGQMTVNIVNGEFSAQIKRLAQE